MSLIPRNYFGDIFDDFMPAVKEGSMKCDIYEKDGDYHIEMDVPGFNKDEIKIEAKKDYLTVTAEKSSEKNEEDKDKNYLHRERSYGKYQRSFYLQDLDSERVNAEFNNGVLSISVPKKDAEEGKKYIEIK
ncbi:MAG: Hsp20/alpha crystallin family protein [Bacilli bacterium]|nr:Hsp20/alpha crystallin family protein [Bacilli bacterium]